MRRYSNEEKAEILKEIEAVGSIHAVCRKRGISHTTAHNWLKKDSLRAGAKSYPAENRRLRGESQAFLVTLRVKNAQAALIH